jgi:MOSC domain-containing protein YiiM
VRFVSEVPSVLRISVARPRKVNWNGNEVATGIFKLAVSGPVRVGRLNLDGDEQADLTVHGGVDKAVYAYPVEHYAYWQDELERSLDWGSFGENLTTEGFNQDSLCIGDRLAIGSAVFVVTQPRMPCFKLGIRLGDTSLVRRFYKSGKWGYYLSVLQEGEIESGDRILHQGGDGRGVSLADVSRCFLDQELDTRLLTRVLKSNLAAQMKSQLEYQVSRRQD